jgi:tetratricopeptide (TPR) repeat protein
MNLLLLALLTLPIKMASALEAGREELAVIGWNAACSVAVTHLAYPRLGEPIGAQIGTLSIAPGEEQAKTRWTIEWSGANSWLAGPARQAIQDLIAAGYDHRGFTEEIRPEPVAPGRDLEAVLVSTASLQARQAQGWPDEDWRLARIHFNRLGTCALVVFDKEGPFFRYVLARIYNPQARAVRARAHLTNGLMLFGQSDLEGALAETRIAAAMHPEGAANRYHHAAMLCLSGYLQEAIAELSEAVKLKPEYRKKALKDIDFEAVAKQPRFRALMKGTTAAPSSMFTDF